MKTRHFQVDRAAYWALRNDVYEPVERAVDSASGWTVFTTLNMAVEGAIENPKHSGLQDFLRGIDFQ